MLGWASTTASDSLSLRSNGSIASMKDALTLSTAFLLAPLAALLAAETKPNSCSLRPLSTGGTL
jgi:hypothetical protein